MSAQTRDDFIFVAFIQFFLHFFQREVHHVVMMQFLRRQHVAEAQPQAMQQIDFIAREVRRVRAENFVDLVPVGQVNFQVELRLLIA